MIKTFPIYSVIAFVFLLGGCSQSNDEPILVRAAKGNSYYGGTLRLSKTEYIRTLYPPAITDPVSAQVASLVYDGLFRTDPQTLKIVPSLAESYEVNADSTIYTFQIKKGVFFHDDPCFPDSKGRELKAADVTYCIIQLCRQSADNQGFIILKSILKGIDTYYSASGKSKKMIVPDAIKVIDDYHFQLQLEKPYPFLIEQLSRPQALIYPIEAISKYGTVRPKAVGTGPFKLAEIERDILISLERNPRYHRHDAPGNQLPFLSQIRIQFIPDKRTELAEFKSGNIQMMYHLPPEQFIEILKIQSMKNKPVEWKNAVLIHKPEMVTHYLAFNFQDKFFKSKSLRKAFAYSLDKTTILGTTLSGEGMAEGQHGIISPLFPTYPFKKVEGIQEALDSARIELENAPLPTEKPTLAFYPDGSRNIVVAIAIMEQIKNTLGIELNLKPMPLTRLYDDLLDGKFTIVLLPRVPENSKPISFLEPFYSKNRITYDSKTYPNFFHYSNASFDNWYEKALASKNEKEMNEFLADADQQLIDDAAVIPLWYDEGYLLLKKNLKNISVNPMAVYDFSEAYFTPEEKPKK